MKCIVSKTPFVALTLLRESKLSSQCLFFSPSHLRISAEVKICYSFFTVKKEMGEEKIRQEIR